MFRDFVNPYLQQREEVTKRMVEKLRQEDLLRSEETGNLDDFLIVNVENESGINAPKEKHRRPQPARTYFSFLSLYRC